ncbi:MAG: hypothetical protein KDH09_00250 [Chrysiogenetes bacterium]|nr:hypothetical protein [Candidatus Dadabacteria bacterium]MCB0218095.1 hypothetical protein [Chrysiogenetes bacterium]
MTGTSAVEASSAAARRRARALSVGEGMLQACMVGFSESYLGAFAVQLGHGDAALALLTTLPLFVGGFAQILSGPCASLLGSYKRLVLVGAAAQTLSHLAFIAIAHTGDTRLWPLLVAKILFWGSGSLITPAWGAWMGELTEDTRQARYFAWRSGAAQLALLASFSAAGVVLHGGEARGTTLAAFALLLSLGFLSRLLSLGVFALQLGDTHPIPWRGLGTRMRLAVRSGSWRIPIFMGALMFGAQLSVPFFTPYMLRVLRLDFGAFAVLTATAIGAKMIVFPLYHPIAERVGLRSVLLFAGMGAVATPVAWAFAPGYGALLAAQVLSGAAWGGVEFASFQLLLGAAGRECRGEFLSLANALSGTLQLAGAVIGGGLLTQLDLEYQQVFLVSSAFRAAALLVLVLSVRAIEIPMRLPRLIWRARTVRPTTGAVREPVLQELIPEEGGREAR